MYKWEDMAEVQEAVEVQEVVEAGVQAEAGAVALNLEVPIHLLQDVIIVLITIVEDVFIDTTRMIEILEGRMVLFLDRFLL